MSNIRTPGQEIIRTSFNPSQDSRVDQCKAHFAELYDWLTSFVLEADKAINEPPAILAAEAIASHMEVIRKNEELMRCISEACRLLEQSAMFAVKGLTA